MGATSGRARPSGSRCGVWEVASGHPSARCCWRCWELTHTQQKASRVILRSLDLLVWLHLSLSPPRAFPVPSCRCDFSISSGCCTPAPPQSGFSPEEGVGVEVYLRTGRQRRMPHLCELLGLGGAGKWSSRTWASRSCSSWACLEARAL